MRILAIERQLPTTRETELEPILRVEAACVWDLQQRGIIRDIWFTVAGHNAVIMLECSSESEARQHLAVLPLVHAGVIDFTVHEMRSYDGFERLFAHRLNPDLDKSKRKRAKRPRVAKPARNSSGRKGNAAGPSGSGGGTRTHSPSASIMS